MPFVIPLIIILLSCFCVFWGAFILFDGYGSERTVGAVVLSIGLLIGISFVGWSIYSHSSLGTASINTYSIYNFPSNGEESIQVSLIGDELFNVTEKLHVILRDPTIQKLKVTKRERCKYWICYMPQIEYKIVKAEK